jgi:hypothetical protein
MTPRPRFVARSRPDSGTWVVFDDLRSHTVSAGNTASVAKFIAHSHEATWRARCARWQQAEHRDSTP